MLLTGRCAAAQTGQNDLLVRDGELPGYFFIATGKSSAHLYVAPGSYLFVHYSAAQKQLLREACVTEAAYIPQKPILVGYGYVQQAGSG